MRGARCEEQGGRRQERLTALHDSIHVSPFAGGADMRTNDPTSRTASPVGTTSAVAPWNPSLASCRHIRAHRNDVSQHSAASVVQHHHQAENSNLPSLPTPKTSLHHSRPTHIPSNSRTMRPIGPRTCRHSARRTWCVGIDLLKKIVSHALSYVSARSFLRQDDVHVKEMIVSRVCPGKSLHANAFTSGDI